MEKTRFYARLSKDRGRVLCAVIDCGGQVGKVGPHPIGGGLRSRVWWLPQGWVRRGDGVYRLAKYARRHIRGGFPANHPHHYERVRMAAHAGWGNLLLWFPPLPCFAECPDCGRRQKIDPHELDVEATPLCEGGSDMLYVPFWYVDQPGKLHRAPHLGSQPPVTRVTIVHSDGRTEVLSPGTAVPDTGRHRVVGQFQVR